jgi:hypothetical protein
MRSSYASGLDLAGAHKLIADARQALLEPAKAAAWLESIPRGLARAEQPAGYGPAVNDPNIVIDPNNHKFEERRDWWGWVVNCAEYWVEGELRKKAPLRRHTDSTDFRYPLPPRPDAPETRVALFSDFGTGLYHSQYIAKRILDARPDCAIHLGDVYYSGRPSDFAANFTPFVDPLAAAFPLYVMNANHEMMAGGFAYYDFIDVKRSQQPALQLQEGSYFALYNDILQIIALDTDYDDDGSHRDAARNLWLEHRLIEGRRRGLINVLLTGDEPYALGGVKPTSLYTSDLARYVLPGMVDLWFWGNTHYCALYRRSARAPFIGSCIGHGGFPYETITRATVSGDAWVEVEWFEDATRFPAATRLRPDMGNNGFVILTAREDRTVKLDYIDWRNEPRHSTLLGQSRDRRSLEFIR